MDRPERRLQCVSQSIGAHWRGREFVSRSTSRANLTLTRQILAGFASIAIFAIRRIRMMQYELFLFFHILGAILVLVGLRYRESHRL